ncbi:hypothetical protein SKTS_14120 [Sulfurimicrobium lacus]|uniref:Uncharacterized protein n=1 Tax=Sulfurimicrobium lacus TaxID=2715678 RepID=A0A6F8VBY9_9PROT|nr:hypothetical protein [Sulfurimicrobium lacus]BCB26526.1 hypothetical protein SKTS_14120 [Sulfurimicrobium lacus]
MRNFLLIGLAAVLFSAVAAIAADRPAMVIDLQGKVTLESGGGAGGIGILSTLSAGATLTLGPQARVVMVYLKSGDEYELAGPGRYQVGVVEPEAISGAKPIKHKTALASYGAGRINPMGKVQAGLVMRGGTIKSLRLLEPSGSLVSSERPTFRWEAVPGAKSYHFELDNDTGATMAEGTVNEPVFSLPAGVVLAEKMPYSWGVETSVDGRQYAKWHQFSVLDKGERERLEKLKPGDNATFGERVLYAAMLEEMGLREDARPLWKTLAMERPDDTRLQALAGD